MIAACEASGVPWAACRRFQRASLEAGCTFEAHMTSHVPAKRRKDLARSRRRLEELGKVEHQIHCSGEGLDQAVSAFLGIEASGWKGKRGTAWPVTKKLEPSPSKLFPATQQINLPR
jgi:hypothetical protein